MPGNLVFDTNTLIQVVQNLKMAQSFLLDKFFPGFINPDSEFVSIDVDVGKRRMSPFCSPLVEGKLVESRRYQTNTFKPPYIKDKRAPDLRKPVRRMIGERIGGELTPEVREQMNLEFELNDQIDMLTRRLEWMGANALLTGTVTVSGEGFPTTVIDFGRDGSLTIALTGGAQWTQANITAGTASPTSNIEAWQTQILKASGAVATDIVFTPKSWAGFKLDPVLKGAEFYPSLAPFGNAVNVGAQIERGGVHKGKWGNYNLWLYNDWYVDDVTNVETPMLPDGALIMSGPDLQGTRAFGIVEDPAFNYASLPFAPKTWVKEDPAQRFLMMQSAPIVIPSRVNAALAATVA
ncbi:major capsid protein [Caballeronia sp. LZ028]|uniref:major capsid protein n=1 Tax=Caballeronia sp. LZ028 TaxID=3038563 RepID=UPI0020289EC6|nr:major capsid protein [Caballeronia sp. LZ028]MDR5765035.1 major capsid protein [Caballeronia sp. LZ028]